MHGHLTLDRIMGPDPVPEFSYCARCDVQLTPKRARVSNECLDCKGLNAYKGNTNRHGGGFPPVDPAYEVFVHYNARPREDRTRDTLDALRIPHFVFWRSADPIEFDWARQLESADFEPDWPIVLISSHGQYVEHWTGFDLAKLNAIPAARATAITTKQRTEAPQPGVPITEEQAA